MNNTVFYIPGDLVMTDGVPLGTAKGVVYRVTATNLNKTLRLKDGTVLKGVVCLENIEDTELGDKGYLFAECYVWVKDIVPLELSSEILQKNGWCEISDGVFEKSIFLGKDEDDEEIYAHLKVFYEAIDGWGVDKEDTPLMYNIHYVSQLQHILFGLGLDSNIKL